MNWLQRTKCALHANGSPLASLWRSKRSTTLGKKLCFESLEQRLALAAVAPGMQEAAQTYSGALNGKIVFANAGHGWEWNTTLGRYATGRSDSLEVEEAFGTQDQLTMYADYLLRAGATVAPLRPIGRQTTEYVLDNDSPNVTYTGTWSNSSSTRYYDEDYGASTDTVPYRFASTTTGAETSVATYTPNFAASGFFPVYTWVLRGTDRANQLYRVNHSGGTTELRVDHSKVGSGWVYLGTYHFNAGSSTALGSVQISNNGAAGDVVIADTIRFGNGMGDYVDSPAPGISGYAREDEASYLWLARAIGVGTSFATAGLTDNVNGPSGFATYMLQATFGDAVYVAIHSNAAGGRGAVGLMTQTVADRTPNQDQLALYLGRQINQDFQALDLSTDYVNLFGPGWTWSNRTTHTYSGSTFGEINLGPSAEFDATIIEVAFHDTAADAEIMREVNGRDQIARSILQGTIEYFQNETGGLPVSTNLPTAPVNVRAVSNASGQVTINWNAGPTAPSGAYGAAATSFKIYTSVDGYGFDSGAAVAGGGTTSATLSGFDPARPYYFRVVAVNNGGESLPSEVMTVLPSGGAKQVLIVNGFDRNDRSSNFRYPYAYTSDGLVDRVWARYNNSRDYVVQVHQAIHAADPGVHVASTSNEAVISGAVNLADYDAVIWISGEESTVEESFGATEQTKVQQFIAGGGHFFVSGSEIGFDLDAQSGGVSFYENTLKANYVSDDAGTYNITPAAGSIFAGMSNFSFSSGNAFSSLDGQVYNVDYPDVISPNGAGSVAALTYNGGTGGTAAIQVQGSGGAGNVVMLAFPFETTTNATRRQNVMDRVLDFFNVTSAAAAIDIQSSVNGQDADSPTGPVLGASGTATFGYVLTNNGTVPLTSVVVSDNNGTPGNGADDFAPTFVGGDANSNNQLDVGETWTYSMVRALTVGQYAGSVSVMAGSSLGGVADNDAVHYLGVAPPSVGIEAFVAGQPADSPPGPNFNAGAFVSLTYQVTNTGTTPVLNVVLTDDNGTPGNTADDVTPAYSGGDANANSQLDVGETWTYSAGHSAVAGQYAGLATVTGNDNLGQVANSSDAAFYFGVVTGVAIQATINGDDADASPGPTLPTGSTASLGYMVTNTGNVPLANVIVRDNNGTPADPNDDLIPVLASGDANNNSLLDPAEVWTYAATICAVTGQQSHFALVIAENGALVEFDATFYVGAVVENPDFNTDGLVDAADYVLWRKFAGTTVPAGTSGDANNDTQVNDDDYLIWNEQYGTPSSGSGGALAAAAGSTQASAVTDLPPIAPAAQIVSVQPVNATVRDAAFESLSRRGTPIRALSGVARSVRVATAVDGQWPALLAALAEHRVRPSLSGNAATDCAVEQSELDPIAGSEGASAERVRARVATNIRVGV